MQLSPEDCELRDAIEHAWNLVAINAETREKDATRDFESEAFLRNYIPAGKYVHLDNLDILRSENDTLRDANDTLREKLRILQNSETAKEATINMLLDRLYESKDL